MPGDRVLVNKVPYYFHDPRRGDIIVFENPNPQAVPDRGVVGGFFHWLFQGIGVQKPENEDFIKRVIGLPGDDGRGQERQRLRERARSSTSRTSRSRPGRSPGDRAGREAVRDGRQPRELARLALRPGLRPDRQGDREGVRHHLAAVAVGLLH